MKVFLFPELWAVVLKEAQELDISAAALIEMKLAEYYGLTKK